MAKHTPGQWEAVAPKNKGQHWKVAARGQLGGGSAIDGASVLWDVATIWNGAPGDPLETQAANAQLMASAPVLLQELKELACIDLWWAWKPELTPQENCNRLSSLIRDSASSAIAKAEDGAS